MTEDLSKRVRTLTRNYTDEAEVYERLWAPPLREFAGPILDRLPDPGAVLDVGAGTGAVLNELRERFPSASIVGLDRAEGMIARADRSYGRAVGDAEQLPLRDATFDAATMLFALFHLADPPEGLAELRRVLRPGGTAGVATWGDREDWPQMDVWHELLTERGAAPAESVLSRHELTDQPEKIEGLLEAGGFGDIETWTRAFERHWETDDFLDFVTGMAISKRRLATVPEENRPGLIEGAKAELERLPEGARRHRPVVVFGMGRS